MNYESYLSHHGILGQKHGVRNGPPYPLRASDHSASEKKAGWRKSLEDPKKRKEIAKKVAIGAAAIGTLTAASMYIAKNPKAIKMVTDSVKKIENVNLKDLSKSTVTKGKNATAKVLSKTKEGVKVGLKSAKEGVKEGLREASKEAPKKLTKTIATGAVIYGGKKILDKTAGKQTSDAIFKANDPKNIGKFWKVQRQEDD